MQYDSALVWFRRDLRDYDHAALAAALASASRVHCLFVFDTEILAGLRRPDDRRLAFIHRSLRELAVALRRRGGCLVVRHGAAVDVVPQLASEFGVAAVFVNRDYEPQAKARDALVARRLADFGIDFREFKDQAIFDRDEVLSQSGAPYSVFTPYRNAWLRRLADQDLSPHGVDADGRLVGGTPEIPDLAAIGFVAADWSKLGVRPGMSGGKAGLAAFIERLDGYAAARDYPALDGTSRLSVHLRFGTVSVRELARLAWQRMQTGASEGARAWLDELIWRDFYFMILDRHPRVVAAAFKPQYDGLRWRDAPRELAAWRDGLTGFPLVDAAMRQLAGTGFMHNRLRMLTASFLTKDLGIDWRAGERHFAECLLDYDLAANNGGWQWAASTGCDAQPWFRIFNPLTQAKKFDPEGEFVRRFVPELAALPGRWIHEPWRMPQAVQDALGVRIGVDYPAPIVDHAAARAMTLARFAASRADQCLPRRVAT